MIRHVLDDPWRVVQWYGALLVGLVLAAAVATLSATADQWTPDGRAVVQEIPR